MGYAPFPPGIPMLQRRVRLTAARLAELAFLTMPLAAAAQLPFAAPTPMPVAEVPAGDPYRRETPRGTFLGFIQAAQKSNWPVAAEYLQWPKSGGRIPREELVRELKLLLDQGFTGDIQKLSRSPLGSIDDGLSPDLERAGQVVAGEEMVDILLTRETPPDGPPIWLVSAQTLREVPRLYKELTVPAIEEWLPGFLKRPIGSLRLWQLVAALLLYPLLFALSWLAVTGVFRPARGWLERHGWQGDLRHALKRARAPSALLLMLVLHRVAIPFLSLPLLDRYRYSRSFVLLAVAAIAWFFLRTVDVLSGTARERLVAAGASPAPTLTLARRLLKGGILLIALLVALSALGVDMTTALAGLGIGGVALAFAAKTSIENIFGGFTVLGARILRVGDTCRIGTFTGTVEDITLFATRLRTSERSLVSIPNGTLLTREIENLSRRDRFLLNHTIGLRCETTPAQLRTLLESLRKLLADHPQVAPEEAHARFVRFGGSSLDIEVLAYVLAADPAGFLAIQEELLLAIAGLVAAAGTGVAIPSCTIYPGKAAPPEPGL
jgi:MscS family membrane protein